MATRDLLPEGPRTVTVDLSRPYTFEGRQITEVSLREPTADMLMQAGQGRTEAEESLRLLSKTSGLPPEFLRTLFLVDYTELGRVLGATFLGVDAPPV